MSELIKETKDYRLSKSRFFQWIGDGRRQILELKIDGQYVFVSSYSTQGHFSMYDQDQLKAHIAHADSKRGWFSNYGNDPNTEDIRFKEGKGNPLHELELGKKYSFDKTFTRLSEIKKGIYYFNGNFENYSGAFWYIIWDKQIIKQIQIALEMN